MSSSQCVVCTRDNPNGFVCDDCVAQLVADLCTLTWLAAELIVTRTRQDRLASNGMRGHMHDEGQSHCYRCAPDPTDPVSLPATALPVHLGATTVYDALHNMLVTTVRDMVRIPEAWPADSPASMVRWIIERTDRIRRDSGADQLVLDVEHHTKAALEVINPLDPNEQTFGVCGAEQRDGTTCTAYLYGAPTTDWVRCRRCRTHHDTRRRIQVLERRIRVMYFRAATLARLLPRFLERPVSANNIRSWAFQGRPIRTSVDDDGFVTYHCGDVIAVAVATPTRNRTSAAERGSA
ncbi:MAG TPA: hypothetical protein VGX25_04080 [Actinophytocola sp.]|uniref:hypothetical protein n=1 Tax=Actinophytocola sp. TaxID=1872138 RepID=UPI002DDD2D8D|nr:hypothetical protein [Actinophytocola sp.]HEV2778557.1 hypothetical protein [Actinophytocola sp.]